MLHLHRSERADRLAEGLAQVLRHPLPDPFTPDVVAVPAKGVERWLAQRLSHVLGAGGGGADGGGQGDACRDGLPDGAPGSRGDGVCANVRFASPAALVAEVVAAGAPAADHRGDDPWERGRLVWPLLDVIDACAGETWCAALAGHLGASGAGSGDALGGPGTGGSVGRAPNEADSRGSVGGAPNEADSGGSVGRAPNGFHGGADYRRGRRLTVASHLAVLLDSYQAYRPDMLRQWAAGSDRDEAGHPLPPDLAWQAELWRRVRRRVGVASPGERLAEACAALRDQPDLVPLPERLSVFGPTRLTTAQLEVLAALAHRREVHLWLPHPSALLWERVAPYAAARTPWAQALPGAGTATGAGTPAITGKTTGDGALPVPAPAPAPAARPRRRTDPTADLPGNPLLASLGRDARELQLMLASCTAGTGIETREHHHPVEDRPATLLGRLQQALQDDAPPAAAPEPRPLLAATDRSLQVHACHGPARQVEVLRDVLVGLLADDPTLEPRDLLVMCPDIEEYAPLISATFGLGGEIGADRDGDDAEGRHPGHRLRVRLADRSLRQTNPLLSTLATLLDLADARLTASEVLDLASSAPVRRRFRFSDDDLELLRDWVGAAGIRWGLDGGHRGPFGLTLEQNTWRAGLDRIQLGAAMADDHQWLGLALPLDEVDSNDISLAGRLAEFVDRLTDVLDGLHVEQPLVGWLAVLDRALDSLAAVPETDAWQAGQARRELAQVGLEAGDRGATVPLSLADVRALLADRLRGRPTRANFRTGNLSMCSMVPMRSVPHRVICLLGLDDGRFPRTSGVDGDDILARDPCVGERDPRSEDRQLLLDAVLAAREHLVILYTGADPRTNAPRPPAVPVGEILDAVDGLLSVGPAGEDGRAAREHVVVRHPLQPFDPRNFRAGKLGRPGPFSFDRHALHGAERAARPRHDRGRFLSADLPPESAEDLALEDLARFLEHPARGFLRLRLGVTLLQDEEDMADAIPTRLTALQLWDVGDRLLQARLAGADVADCRQAEWRRGTLPPGELGRTVLDDLIREVEPLVLAATDVRRGDASVLDVAVAVGGRRLGGSVGGIHGDSLVRVVYSKLGAKHRLRAWAQLLALRVAHPQRPWTAVTLGRGPRGIRRSTLEPPPLPAARELLAGVVDVYARGLRAPLPVAARTSAAYAAKRVAKVSPGEARDEARKEWSSGQFGEQADAAHQLVWGTGAALEVLLADPPRPDESGRGWAVDEPTRFGALARRLWDPLLAAETMGAA